MLNNTVSYEKSEQVQQANVFKRHTLSFICQRIIQTHLNIYPITRRADCARESTAAIVASVVETRWWPGRSSSTTLSRQQANFFLHFLLLNFLLVM